MEASTAKGPRHRPIALSWKGPASERTLRETGIDLIGRVPWGTHLSLFCETKRDIIESAVCYFRPAALSNEHCIWVVSEPVDTRDALRALRAVPELERLRAKAAFEVVDGTSWYQSHSPFDRRTLIEAWKQRIATALERNFDGVRAFGNPLWRNVHQWVGVKAYERDLEKLVAQRPVIMLCVYSMRKSWPEDVFDLARTHQSVIARRRGAWEFLNTRHADKAKKEIDILNADLDHLSQLEAELTERERVVLSQIVKGESSKTAGGKLGISPRTVEYHRANAMQKLGAKNTAELVRIVLKGR